jgi:two-component system, NarL family, sensor kinase
LFGILGYKNFKTSQKLQQQQITRLERDKQLLAIDAMLKGQEEERGRLAKDLHDGLGGMLSGVKLNFNNIKETLIMDVENTIRFKNSILQLDNSIVELRKVAHNLMPEGLVKFGLKNSVLDYCNSMQLSSNVKILYEQLGEERSLENTKELVIYRILQELINNAIKHANAKQIVIQLIKNKNNVLITVEDDGKGFIIDDLKKIKGIGIRSVQQRVDYLMGTIYFDSKLDVGTFINIELAI